MYVVVFQGVSGTCIHRQSKEELAPFDPEVKRTIKKLRRERRVLVVHNFYLANMVENLQ